MPTLEQERFVEEHFVYFWETTVLPGTAQGLVGKWREYELLAVQRGQIVVDRLLCHTTLTGCTVIDLGCGYGGLSVALAQAGAFVVGTDYDMQRVQGASIRTKYDYPECKVELIQSAAERTPLPDECFDIVVCSDILEHVGSHEQTLREIGRVLRVGGFAYFTFPNRLSPSNFLHDPHYGLLGASLLPPTLGKWYVVFLRKKAPSYDVGTFPIASRVIRMLKATGMQVVEWWPAPQRQVGIFTPLLRLYRLNTHPLVTLICCKQGFSTRCSKISRGSS